jgi:hypothetical protein
MSDLDLEAVFEAIAAKCEAESQGRIAGDYSVDREARQAVLKSESPDVSVGR